MQTINIVWLKRDLRLTDHAPLQHALSNQHPTILLYIFEPMLLSNAHYSERHWRFVWQSLQCMNQSLKEHGHEVSILHGSAMDCFEAIQTRYHIQSLFSHQEIGLNCTFERDKQISDWFQEHNIQWQEFAQGAVVRGSKDRIGWDKHWNSVMRAPIEESQLTTESLHTLDAEELELAIEPPQTWLTKGNGIQTGGSALAWATLHDFFERRGRDYYRSISSPEASRHACTRLSPYLAWGNISLREVYQHLLRHWQVAGFRRSLIALSSRLHWHCHFMQKFESECEMEFRCINHAYEALLQKETVKDPARLNAWKMGGNGRAIGRCLYALPASYGLYQFPYALYVGELSHSPYEHGLA